METNVSTVIVVTGASRGIGKAIALSLAAPDTYYQLFQKCWQA